MTEIWKQIPETIYFASSFGRIKNRFGRILKTANRINNSGYESICLSGVTKSVHVWIAMAFLGEANGRHVNHKNGNKRDNSSDNLEWVSRSENMKHAFKIGLIVPYDRRGTKNPNAKLSEFDIKHIRQWYATGEFTQWEIARAFNIKQARVSAITRGEL